MMNRRSLLLFGLVVAVLCLCPSADADTWTLTLIPSSGSIAGPAGSTLGWGYTIANNSSNTLILMGISADSFLHATPNAFVFDFPIVGPNASVTTFYSPGLAGLYELTWDATAPVGFVNSGTFLLNADWCDAAGGCLAAPGAMANYTATVSPAAAVPEPTTLVLLLTGIAGIALRRHR